MIKFTIKPYDVLYFGSGKPFNRGDVVTSIFPPHPTTFAGAICSKIRTEKGIDTSNILTAVYGPFIRKKGKLYFPKPQNIYGERKREASEKIFVVKPLHQIFKLFDWNNTNIPFELQLPVYKGDEEIEHFEGFISLNGLKTYLNGETPQREEILTSEDIFEREQRVGIKIDPSRYSVGGEEDALYRIEFLRLKDDVDFLFWVDFNFNNEMNKIGLSRDENALKLFNEGEKILKLGGEMKNARYEVEKDDFHKSVVEQLGLPRNIRLNKGDKTQFLFLSYGVMDIFNSSTKINGFKITSMALKGYEVIGVYSESLGKRKTARALPPGTVMWLEYENQNEITIQNPSFLIKKDNNFVFGVPEGVQDFIGTNLILIKKGG